LAPDKDVVHPGRVRLLVSGLCVDGDRGQRSVDNIDLEIRSGEIVGIAGVSGNGQREFAEAVAGLRIPAAGSILIDDTDVAYAGPAQTREAGLAYVPEERMRDGAIGEFSVAENLMLLDHGDPRFASNGFIKRAEVSSHATTLVDNFRVKTPSIDTATSSLSGGNIQKVIMARELDGDPAVLIASQPTRGVDIGAAEYIHERLVAQREQGTAIVVISEDLDEVMGLSDRIAVMFDGKVMAVLDRDECTVQRVGLLMAGVEESATPTTPPG
ncbi:MAG: ATP-binding cassette domain-containing protein, partial [Actinomycetia bacterium]|nr:ATP-binding cassette domain-containing protein [Actinomycetes bacterium]